MDRSLVLAVIFVVLIYSSACEASVLRHLRKLSADEQVKTSSAQQDSPIPSPDSQGNATTIINSGKSDSRGSQQSDANNGTQSVDPIIPKDGVSEVQSPSGNNNVSAVSNNGTKTLKLAGENEDKTSSKGNGGASNSTASVTNSRGTCNGSLTSCKDQGLYACIETSRDGGSKKLFLVVQNQKESTLKVKASFPDQLGDDSLPELEVAPGKDRKMDVSERLGHSSTVLLTSGNAKCVLHLSRPDSAFSLMNQLSFYHIQATPVFAVYAAGVIVLVLGGVAAFWKIRRRKQNEVPYRELEMGLPDSAVDAADGWDNEWDSDNWDEGSAVQSPAARGRPSANGITSRSPAKEGWDTGWED